MASPTHNGPAPWDAPTQERARATLLQGAAQLGVALSASQQEALIAYLGLLHKWSKVYNLTAVRDPMDMVTLHLLDSLAVVPALVRHLQNNRASTPSHDPRPTPAAPADGPSATQSAVQLLDVGAGAGLPGVVIAIACSHVQVTCVDAVAKKAAFVQQAAASLGLPNLRGQHQRVEHIHTPFDVVCSRAFASLADFVQGSAAALAPGGVWLALKGKTPDDEVAQLGQSAQVFHVEQLQVPGLDAQRCLVWMRPTPPV